MAAKSESVHPPKFSEFITSGSMPGVTGRTPDVPEVDQIPLDVTMRPMEAQSRCAAGVARELGARTYASDFGKHAPAAGTVVSLLRQATAFADEAARAEAWLAYLAAQRDRAWHQALAVMGEFKPHFDLADASDPNVASRYAATKAFFAARAAVVTRANATRRRNRVAKKNTPA